MINNYTILTDLAKAKVLFQQRAILAAMGMNPDEVISRCGCGKGFTHQEYYALKHGCDSCYGRAASSFSTFSRSCASVP